MYHICRPQLLGLDDELWHPNLSVADVALSYRHFRVPHQYWRRLTFPWRRQRNDPSYPGDGDLISEQAEVCHLACLYAHAANFVEPQTRPRHNPGA